MKWNRPDNYENNSQFCEECSRGWKKSDQFRYIRFVIKILRINLYKLSILLSINCVNLFIRLIGAGKFNSYNNKKENIP